MARPLRHHDADRWHHITSRGMGRQALFLDGLAVERAWRTGGRAVFAAAKSAERTAARLKTDQALQWSAARVLRLRETPNV
ncbi:MAG TPA: hypothetical protein P5026_12390 [Kiritimatiellia bacterium]|nr:hypothetical protein [Kiritimatiellia bacterium]